MLMGTDALSDPASPSYLPDDMQFYGQGPEATYALAAYFGESASAVSAKVRMGFQCFSLVLKQSCRPACGDGQQKPLLHALTIYMKRDAFPVSSAQC